MTETRTDVKKEILDSLYEYLCGILKLYEDILPFSRKNWMPSAEMTSLLWMRILKHSKRSYLRQRTSTGTLQDISHG